MEAIAERYYTCTTNTQEYDLNDFIEHLDIPKLTDEERDRIEEPITLQDCKLALDTFQAIKSPGEDGFTVEFYKYFVGLLGEDLVASFNASCDANELSISQRRGVITCTLIPKEDQSLLELSNRPFSKMAAENSNKLKLAKIKNVYQQ